MKRTHDRIAFEAKERADIMIDPRHEPPRIRMALRNELDLLLEVDEDATRLFEENGVAVAVAGSHPFVRAERTRWTAALEAGSAYLSEDASGDVRGIAILRLVDGAPYLEQLSVRRAAMGSGLGSALLVHALDWARSRGDALWLTTYSHLVWNRPFYERRGFECVDETKWGPELRTLVEEQRTHLPFPAERVAMRADLHRSANQGRPTGAGAGAGARA